MTRDDIIRMAKEAGAKTMVSSQTHPEGPTTAYSFRVADESLEKFAQLVAAHERKRCAMVCFDAAKESDFHSGFASSLGQRIQLLRK